MYTCLGLILGPILFKKINPFVQTFYLKIQLYVFCIENCNSKDKNIVNCF